MRIHFIISSLGGGGAERVLTLMANSLALNAAHEVSVITFLPSNERYPLHEQVKKVKLNGMKYVPSHTLRSIFNLFRYYSIKANRPDIIVSFLTLNNFMSILVARFFSIKIMVQEHNSHLRAMEGRKRLSDFTKKYLYRHADILTVLTSFDVPFYERYGANVYVMPNPCSFAGITSNDHKRAKTILAVGGLDRHHHKGFDNLIQLIKPILDEYPDWTLKIAGSGEEGLHYLTNIAASLDISDRIIFTGFIDDISVLMKSSAIFILSSRYEGLPMVLIEAMSQGMACIAYDCKTGPSDIITHQSNGLLIEDQNMSLMQKGLRELIENQELREQLSNAAIASLDTYDIKNITHRYETLFHQIVHGK